MRDQPNILLLFPDQLRFDWVGFNPYIPVRTPNLDRLARNGMTFTRAICPSPLCAPSRACLAAGREYDRCGVADNNDDYPLEQPTFYRLLRDAGYQVMGCGKFDLHKASHTWGHDGRHLLPEWGFNKGIDNEGKLDGVISGAESPKGPYMHFLREQGLLETHAHDISRRRRDLSLTHPTPLPDQAYCDNWLTRNGLRLLEQTPRNQPWFLQVNFTGPHSPWDITGSMTSLYRDTKFPAPVNAGDRLTPQQHQAIRRNYAAMVENIDRNIGLLLEAIATRGELDRTFIVFSSDHGEMLGDHGRFGKNLPYHPSVSVPLVFHGPGVTPGTTFSGPTTTMDLAATFLDCARVDIPPDMDSRSLRRVLDSGTRVHRQAVTAGLGNWRMVYDGRYKLIRGLHGNPELLFDLDRDPGERENIAAGHTRIRNRLLEYLPASAD